MLTAQKTRKELIQFCRDEMNRYGLTDWSIRLSNQEHGFLGMCLHRDKCIILNNHHLDIHPELEIINTIRHEIAHALVGTNHGHNEIWTAKAKEVGCTSVAACSHLSLSPNLIDAIRSGASVEVTFETDRPKYQITRLQDKCDVCGKVAEEKFSRTIENPSPLEPDTKFVSLKCGHFKTFRIPKGTPYQTLVTYHWDSRVAKCQHEWKLNQCEKCLEYKLFPFQVEGARFIEQALATNKGVLLCDEMGLGKTIQVLSYLWFNKKTAFPALFIVKSAIKFNWFSETLRMLGEEYVPQIIEKSDDYVIPNMKCYVSSYDLFVFKTRTIKGKTINQGFDINKLLTKGLKTVILDECQQIKNPDAARTKEVRKLVTPIETKVIGISGTPWKNRGNEYFPILNMIAPIKFPSYAQFFTNWVDTYEYGTRTMVGGIKKIKQFKEFTQDIILRREIKDVMKEMPEVVCNYLHTQLDKIKIETVDGGSVTIDSRSEYDKATEDFVNWYQGMLEEGNSVEAIAILAKLARMRHIIGLAKIPFTEGFVDDFIESTDRKICVYIHHKDVGDILYRNLHDKYAKHIDVIKFTGEMSGLDKFEAQQKFQTSKRAIGVLSTQAAGEGINLQTCADAIMHERQWNPMNETQAAPGRHRRIGSKYSTVNVTYMLASGTVDDILNGINSRKLHAFHNAMNSGEVTPWSQSEFTKELATKIVENWKARNN